VRLKSQMKKHLKKRTVMKVCGIRLKHTKPGKPILSLTRKATAHWRQYLAKSGSTKPSVSKTL